VSLLLFPLRTTSSSSLNNLILRCEPTGLAFDKPEDSLREPRRMVATARLDEHPSRPGKNAGHLRMRLFG
jgi:hypothetical protein